MAEQKFYGIKASRGIAHGKVMLYQPKELVVSTAAIAREHIDTECERLNIGLKRAQKYLEQVYEQAKQNLGDDEAEIFAGHLEILNDEDLIEEIQELISGKLLCAEAAALQGYEVQACEMEELDNEYMRARAADLRDIGTNLCLCDCRIFRAPTFRRLWSHKLLLPKTFPLRIPRNWIKPKYWALRLIKAAKLPM